MDTNDRERDYYRAVEDLFAQLRGTIHVLSPKDFQLLRTWWREGVPLAAVTAGIVETFSKKRERGDDDPVVSLSYCRHAVRRHAKRMAESAVGGETPPAPPGAADHDLALLDEALERAEARNRELRPEVARVIGSVRSRVALLAGGDPGSVETGLFALEESLLRECWAALGEEERGAVEAAARRAAGDPDGATPRSLAAHRDRELRSLLGLPRLELP